MNYMANADIHGGLNFKELIANFKFDRGFR